LIKQPIKILNMLPYEANINYSFSRRQKLVNKELVERRIYNDDR
jgi:hypothetical protein